MKSKVRTIFSFSTQTIYFNLSFLIANIHKNLKYFETIHVSELEHHIIKRGLQESSHPFNKIREVAFNTLGRDFRLILTPKRGVLHSKFKAYAIDGDGKETSIHLGRTSICLCCFKRSSNKQRLV